MAGVAFVFVRDDASEAEILADAFERAGYFITGCDANGKALNVVVWSRAALRSTAFRAAAQRALNARRVIVASLIAPPEAARVLDARVVDLSAWDGEDNDALAELIDAADAVLRPALPPVIALPAYEDAEFSELKADPVADWARRSWEAPIPTQMLRPVREAPPPAKLGAGAPRREFRRRGARSSSRAPAALAFIGIALIGVGVAFANLQPPAAPPPPPHAHVQLEDDGGVSLSAAAANTAGLDDFAPIEPALQQRGHAGVEPPSAPVRPASYSRNGG